MKETRKLNAILFADIVGYTSIMNSNEDKAMSCLQSFKQLLEKLVPEYEGRIVQYFGDACLLSFDSSTLGVKCAISLQKGFREESLPVRIAMHLGEVVFTENNAFGDGVNIASRIESMGIPGSVLLSGSIRNQIKNKSEFLLTSLGSYEFKNVMEPIEVFALQNEGLAVPIKSNIRGKFKTGNKKPKNLYWTLGLSVLIIFTFLAIAKYQGFVAGSDDAQSVEVIKNSIAVLPLINLNKSEDLDYFSDGVTQEIIDELAKINSIDVSAFTLTYQYKNQEKQQDQIARELGVNYLISGSSRYFVDDERIKLSIELIDPFRKKRLWNRTFDVELEDAPTIQLAVAKEVAENLNIKLTTAEEKNLAEPNTSSGEAFRYFLHAKAEINKLTPAGYENGSGYLEEAIKLDPDYSQAYSLYAWRFAVGASADFIPGVVSSEKSLALANPLMDKAMELDPGSSDNYVIRAFLKLYLLNNIQDAKKDIEKAFNINSWPDIPINYCLCTAVSTYIAANDLEKAKEVIKMAKKIDPGHVLYDWDLGNVAMKEGNYLKAQEHYRASVDKADFHFFNTFLGWSYYYNEQYEDALKYLNKAYNNSHLAPRFTVSTLSITYLKMGDWKKSDTYLQELLQREAGGEHHLSLYIASVYLEKENIGKTLDYLEKGVANSDFGFAVFLSLMPKFKVLESEPRFQKVLRKIQSDGI
jgi:TolB-like protein/class 3 adenylate cyclase/Tfp pilus assembly protein PilF